MHHTQPNQIETKQYQSVFEAVIDGLIISDVESGLIVEANHAACKMHGYTREEFIGLSLNEFLRLKNEEVFKGIHMLEVGKIFGVQVIHTRRDSSTLHAEWIAKSFNSLDHACLLWTVRDIGERIESEQNLNQIMEMRMHEQAMLLDISHTLASTLELQPQLILNQLGKVIEYDHAGLFSLENSTFVTLAMRGTFVLEQSIPIRMDMDDSETLKIFFNRHRPILIADLLSDTPEVNFLHSRLNEDAHILLEGMRSWMWVPLAVQNRIIGGFGLAHAQINYFTAHQADLVLSVANQAAITMVNAELYKQAQELAVLEERQRLARNLHDAVNQSLFSAGLIAEVLPRLWEQNQDEARRSLVDLRRLTRAAAAELRALLAELLPSTLTDAELGDLLLLLSNAFTGRTNILVSLTVEGVGLLPAKVQVAVYRVSQEALMNIAKHAKAKHVEIILKYTQSTIELKIKDDGIGFELAKTMPGHYGLQMMGERAEVLNMQLAINSQIGQGTTLEMYWEAVEKKEAK